MRTYRLLIGLSALALATASQASLILLTSRAAVNATDSITMGQYGSNFTAMSNPASGMTTNGALITMSTTGSGLERIDQGSGWTGNFTNGDQLVWAFTNDVTVNFDRSYQAVGSDIQADLYGSFTATLTAYDALGNDLGSVTENGVSNGNSDGSAIFIGVRDTNESITRVSYTVSSSDGLAVDMQSLQNCTPVPEPSAIAAFAIGGIGLFLRRRK